MPAAWDIGDLMLEQGALGLTQPLLDSSQWYFHLFQNDFTPEPGVDSSDFVEADFDGYSTQIYLYSQGFTPAIVDHVASITADELLEYECTGGGEQLVYGYWVTRDGSTYRYSERFSSPIPFTNGAVFKLRWRLLQQTLPS